MKDFEDDRSAIIAVLEAETDAYLRRDYAAWEACWHDGPEIRRIHGHAGTGVTVSEGAEIRQQMRRILADEEGWAPPVAIIRENLNIVMGTDMAWVSYEQRGDPAGFLTEMAGHYHELKILHKVDGAWKIACIVGNQVQIDNIAAPLIEVDETARVLWMNPAARDRLPDHARLGLRGKQLCAIDPRAQSDLMAAIAWIAEIRDRHKICLITDTVNRPIALGQDDAGLAHICWALLRDGKCLITFDDPTRLDYLLSIATEVFGLSKTQEKLAHQVIAGCDLSQAAHALGISPNTAKTHLQRIYDKTGVRTQAALVRILLSVDRHGM
ncbi:DUF4440 domain-containing protein [Yoonia sp. BS5-3]|uniref:DUF4440 domain-containing protein n=1 Tax=Yoonia phaeophyticola TaxID=3137369 RepID=A0ABZ2V508_9RHOB